MDNTIFNFLKHKVVHKLLKSAAKLCEPQYCCDMMKRDLTHSCDQCLNRFRCADCLIHRGNDGSYGIIIHDGSGSWIKIKYCPWCGTCLE